jgi:uncharacterized protein YrrD
VSSQLTEDLKGSTVVSIEGDDIAVVDGLVRDGDDVRALQLVKTGLFGGSMDEVLPAGHIIGIGPDAVVVATAEPFVLPEDLDEVDASVDILSEDAPTLDTDVDLGDAVLFSAARHRDVLSAADGECVGRLDRFVVHPTEQRVGSIRLDKVPDMHRYLSWHNIEDFGDVVTVADGNVLRLPDGPREERIRRDYGMVTKIVLTDTGHELGRITDVAFDPTDGSVTALVLEDGTVAGDRVRGIGPHAVVVAH